MSMSPRLHLRPLSNLSLSSTREAMRREEDLINAFEADQERITLTLSRKLEQLRSEKIQLENTLEAESESQVLRLSRQLSALRLAQQQMQQQQAAANSEDVNSHSTVNDVRSRSEVAVPSTSSTVVAPDPRYPNTDTILEALRRENDILRKRLTDTERDYVRLSRMNDIYREELIEHRRRLGLSVDSLIGLSGASVANSPAESLSQPVHLRVPRSTFANSSASSASSSPEFTQVVPNRATGATPIPIHPNIFSMPTSAPVGLPIPRANGQSQRRVPAISTASSSTTSPSSSVPPSPFTSSPSNHTIDANASYDTQATTPPSSASPVPLQGLTFQPMPHQLSYPSVPPPSLSSSLGSPVVSLSPDLSRRNSVGQGPVGGGGGPGSSTISGRRRVSIERGARIAETGSLLGRGRGGGSRIGE